MALDVYFRSDIENIIIAVKRSSGGTAKLVHQIADFLQAQGENPDAKKVQFLLDIYSQGHTDALNAVAQGFGIVTATNPQTALFSGDCNWLESG